MNFSVAKSKLQPFCQEKDRKEALKAFRDVLERQAPLRGAGWVLFFKQRQDLSPLEDCPSQGCVYLPGQGGWKRTQGLPQTCREGAVTSPLGQVHCVKTAPPMLPNRKMHSHSMLLCATTRCPSNANHTSSSPRDCHWTNAVTASSMNLHVRTDGKMLSYWFKWSMFIISWS